MHRPMVPSAPARALFPLTLGEKGGRRAESLSLAPSRRQWLRPPRSFADASIDGPFPRPPVVPRAFRGDEGNDHRGLARMHRPMVRPRGDGRDRPSATHETRVMKTAQGDVSTGVGSPLNPPSALRIAKKSTV